MRASVGDVLRSTGRNVGAAERRAAVIEVPGPGGESPHRVQYDDGRQTEIFPGSGCLVDTHEGRLTVGASIELRRTWWSGWCRWS
ncbi:DUF1918 domain-containing protein [Streptomyces sp. NPDC005209]|uniref:DUF1918 domain-containing protein n=1 Tax=Streptomyces sp. NPDC005209 TaxID=3156715 RepID=UPI0033BBD8C9